MTKEELAFALFASCFDIENPAVLAACRSDYFAPNFDLIRPDFIERATKVLAVVTAGEQSDG